jgi:hypothetical protein
MKNQSMEQFLNYINLIDSTDIVITEEIDTLFQPDGSLKTPKILAESNSLSMDEFLRIFDGVLSENDTVWICTTNYLERLPDTFTRRMNKIVQFGMPDDEDIKGICTEMDYKYTEEEYKKFKEISHSKIINYINNK